MKRIFLAIVAVCCAFACVLVGCSGGGAHKADAESLKGFWVLEDGSLGFTGMLNLEDEDFAEILIADTYLEGAWTTDGSNASITFSDVADSKPVNIYVEGDKLIYGSESGSHFVFIKSNEDDFYKDQEISGDGLDELTEGELSSLGEEVEVVDEVIEDIKPVTIADDSTVKIEVTGKGTDFTSDPGYRLSITNKTKKAFFLGAEDTFKVDGHEIEVGLGDVLDAGDTVESFMYFSKDDLGGGVEKLKNVEGTIVVYDDESEEKIGTYTFKME
ncbi:MAG: hypothetical protein IJI68_11265 [Eggerthellaceae bacterium]|nr:hypothetical protein [Eggerthellaceae bacterium]